MFTLFFTLFLPFTVCDGKDGKVCLSAKKDDFNQRTACKASVGWSKYMFRVEALSWPRLGYFGNSVLGTEFPKYIRLKGLKTSSLL